MTSVQRLLTLIYSVSDYKKLQILRLLIFLSIGNIYLRNDRARFYNNKWIIYNIILEVGSPYDLELYLVPYYY